MRIEDILDGDLQRGAFSRAYLDLERATEDSGFSRIEGYGPERWRLYLREGREHAWDFCAFRDEGERTELLWGNADSLKSLQHDLTVVEELRSLHGAGRTLLHLGVGKGRYQLSDEAYLRRATWALCALSRHLSRQ